jgi:lysophospholipase L1-like esterase
MQTDLDKRGGTPRYEVLNLGVMGYDTVNEVSLLEHVGLGLAPDLVIICFFLNDADVATETPGFLAPAGRPGPLPTWRQASLLLDLVARAVERRNEAEFMIRSYEAAFQEDAPGWQAAQRALARAASLAKERRFRLVLTIFPMLWRLDDGYPFAAIHAKVAATATVLGVPVLDLLAAFTGQRAPALWVSDANQHPNERGHAIAGDALLQFLAEQSLLRPQ